MEASKHIPKERLGSTDDCGFSPFSIDVKPNTASRRRARHRVQKITSRVKGTAMASESWAWLKGDSSAREGRRRPLPHCCPTARA